jgi:hypothetical protein
MQKLLPGMIVGIALFLIVTHPTESADWASSAATWLGDVLDSLLKFLKQLIQ